MIMSGLARKVFEQTKLPLTIQNVWWVERKLQEYAVNGLVLMINKSKSFDHKYMNGYYNLYKWALRKDVIDINGFDWLFQILQSLSCDFSWSAWIDLITVNPIHMDLFIESVNIAKKNNTENIQYIMTIYKSAVNQAIVKNQEIEKEKIKIIDSEPKNIGSKLKYEWEKLRGEI